MKRAMRLVFGIDEDLRAWRVVGSASVKLRRVARAAAWIEPRRS